MRTFLEDIVFIEDNKSLFVSIGFGSENAPDVYFGDLRFFEWSERYQMMESNLLVSNEIKKVSDYFSLFCSAEQVIYPDGIILMKGPSILENKELENADTIDLTPTLLYIYGLPVPLDMDGEVLIDAFSETYRKNNPVIYEDIDLRVEKNRIGESSEDIDEKLRKLGYLN